MSRKWRLHDGIVNSLLRGMRSCLSEAAFRMNMCNTPLEKAREFAERQFEIEDSPPLDVVLPDFDENYRLLQGKCKQSLGVRRIDMPVIDPNEIPDFEEALRSGRLDIVKPWAKGMFTAPKNLRPGTPEAEEWVTLGFADEVRRDDIVQAAVAQVPVGRLKPIQSQLWLEKVIAAVAQFGPARPGAPIFKKTIVVSDDDYILDGHHRWAQGIVADPKIRLRALVVPIPVKRLLPLLRTFGNAELGNVQRA